MLKALEKPLKAFEKQFQELDWSGKMRALRVLQGMTQGQLGEKLGTSDQVVRSWECKWKKPNSDNRYLIAKALGVEEYDIFPRPDKKG